MAFMPLPTLPFASLPTPTDSKLRKPPFVRHGGIPWQHLQPRLVLTFICRIEIERVEKSIVVFGLVFILGMIFEQRGSELNRCPECILNHSSWLM